MGKFLISCLNTLSLIQPQPQFLSIIMHLVTALCVQYYPDAPTTLLKQVKEHLLAAMDETLHCTIIIPLILSRIL